MKSFLDSIDVSTRGNRRKAATLAIELLEKIRNAEELYMKRIPFNMQSWRAYSAADDSSYYIVSAIIALLNAY